MSQSNAKHTRVILILRNDSKKSLFSIKIWFIAQHIQISQKSPPPTKEKMKWKYNNKTIKG